MTIARITIPGTEQTVSRLGLGTMTFGSQVSIAEGRRMLDHGLAHGIEVVDTANAYNAGRAEEMLGELLYRRRQHVFVATKVGLDGDFVERGLGTAAIRHHAEASLRRLRTDYLDAYLLHRPDPATPIAETLRALHDLVVAGKVRFIGICNYGADAVRELVDTARARELTPPRFGQYLYNVLARGAARDVLPACREAGMLTMAYNPLAGGLLTGKHDPGAPPRPGTRFALVPTYRDRYWFPAMHDAVRRIAAATGGSPHAVALRWLLHHTEVGILLLGAADAGQLADNIAAACDGPLCAELVDALDRVWSTVEDVAPQHTAPS